MSTPYLKDAKATFVAAQRSLGIHRIKTRDELMAVLIQTYRSNAERRGLPFLLSDEEAKRLFLSDCAYCGSPPGQLFGALRGTAFLRSGIDRVDSAVGYEPDNCRPCCKRCNWAKNRDTLEEFEAWIERLIKFRTKR